MENVLGANKGVVQTLIVAVLTVALATVVGGVAKNAHYLNQQWAMMKHIRVKFAVKGY